MKRADSSPARHPAGVAVDHTGLSNSDDEDAEICKISVGAVVSEAQRPGLGQQMQNGVSVSDVPASTPVSTGLTSSDDEADAEALEIVSDAQVIASVVSPAQDMPGNLAVQNADRIGNPGVSHVVPLDIVSSDAVPAVEQAVVSAKPGAESTVEQAPVSDAGAVAGSVGQPDAPQAAATDTPAVTTTGPTSLDENEVCGEVKHVETIPDDSSGHPATHSTLAAAVRAGASPASVTVKRVAGSNAAAPCDQNTLSSEPCDQDTLSSAPGTPVRTVGDAAQRSSPAAVMQMLVRSRGSNSSRAAGKPVDKATAATGGARHVARLSREGQGAAVRRLLHEPVNGVASRPPTAKGKDASNDDSASDSTGETQLNNNGNKRDSMDADVVVDNDDDVDIAIIDDSADATTDKENIEVVVVGAIPATTGGVADADDDTNPKQPSLNHSSSGGAHSHEDEDIDIIGIDAAEAVASSAGNDDATLSPAAPRHGQEPAKPRPIRIPSPVYQGPEQPPVVLDKPPVLKHLTYIVDNEYLDRGRKKDRRRTRMECECDSFAPVRCHDDSCLNRMMMIECSRSCGTSCMNQRFANRDYADSVIIRTERRGHGLIAGRDIRKGEFIIEYVGEVMNQTRFMQRMERYADTGVQDYYFMSLDGQNIVDAYQKGNVSRFINHSCEPNCVCEKWMVSGEIRVGIFAKQDLAKGTELTFDYHYDRYGQHAQRCYCGAATCRGLLGGDTQVSVNGIDTPVTGGIRLEHQSVDELLAPLVDPASGAVLAGKEAALARLLMYNACERNLSERIRFLDVLLATTDDTILRTAVDHGVVRVLKLWMRKVLEPPVPDDGDGDDAATPLFQGDERRQLIRHWLRVITHLPLSYKQVHQHELYQLITKDVTADSVIDNASREIIDGFRSRWETKVKVNTLVIPKHIPKAPASQAGVPLLIPTVPMAAGSAPPLAGAQPLQAKRSLPPSFEPSWAKRRRLSGTDAAPKPAIASRAAAAAPPLMPVPNAAAPARTGLPSVPRAAPVARPAAAANARASTGAPSSLGKRHGDAASLEQSPVPRKRAATPTEINTRMTPGNGSVRAEERSGGSRPSSASSQRRRSRSPYRRRRSRSRSPYARRRDSTTPVSKRRRSSRSRSPYRRRRDSEASSRPRVRRSRSPGSSRGPRRNISTERRRRSRSPGSSRAATRDTSNERRRRSRSPANSRAPRRDISKERRRRSRSPGSSRAATRDTSNERRRRSRSPANSRAPRRDISKERRRRSRSPGSSRAATRDTSNERRRLSPAAASTRVSPGAGSSSDSMRGGRSSTSSSATGTPSVAAPPRSVAQSIQHLERLQAEAQQAREEERKRVDDKGKAAAEAKARAQRHAERAQRDAAVTRMSDAELDKLLATSRTALAYHKRVENEVRKLVEYRWTTRRVTHRWNTDDLVVSLSRSLAEKTLRYRSRKPVWHDKALVKIAEYLDQYFARHAKELFE